MSAEEINDLMRSKFSGSELLFYCYMYMEGLHLEPTSFERLFEFLQYKTVMAAVQGIERSKVEALRSGGNNGKKQ